MSGALYNFFRDQGSIIAGVLALIAGWIAYRAGHVQATATKNAAVIQIEAAQRRDERELDDLRKSLAIELRQVVPIMLGVHKYLKDLSNKNEVVITSRMIEYSPSIPIPRVYLGKAHKISLLGNDGMDIMIIYNLVEGARDRLNKLARYYRTPDNISHDIVNKVALYCLEICAYARGVLPRIKNRDSSV